MTLEDLKTSSKDEIVNYISGLEIKDRLEFLLSILDEPNLSTGNLKDSLKSFKDELLSLSVFNIKLLKENDGKDWNLDNIVTNTIDFLNENKGKDIPAIAMNLKYQNGTLRTV